MFLSQYKHRRGRFIKMSLKWGCENNSSEVNVNKYHNSTQHLRIEML